MPRVPITPDKIGGGAIPCTPPKPHAGIHSLSRHVDKITLTLEKSNLFLIFLHLQILMGISSFVIQWHVTQIEILCRNLLSKCHSDKALKRRHFGWQQQVNIPLPPNRSPQYPQDGSQRQKRTEGDARA